MSDDVTTNTDYDGDVTPKECWDTLSSNADAVLVDVRSQAEWAFVGVVQIAQGMATPVAIPWQIYPEMEIYPLFAQAVDERLTEMSGGDADKAKSRPLYFLCRSGARSLAAARAMKAAGYGACYNVAGGFEGDVDSEGHRGQVNGWKADGLPWRQQ